MRVETIDDAVLYCGDCLEVLPTLDKVDSVVTDPPYGIAIPCNYRQRGRGRLAKCRNYEDIIGDDAPFEPGPILSLNLPTVLFGANWYADKLPPMGGWLVWDKRCGRMQNDQADAELAWSNCVKGVRVFHHEWNGFVKASEKGEGYHPAGKPVAVMVWILSLRWMPTGIVLDPFMGSGTTGVACAKLGRKFIGIEIEEKYFDIACKRIEDAYKQPRLFDEPKQIATQLRMEM